MNSIMYISEIRCKSRLTPFSEHGLKHFAQTSERCSDSVSLDKLNTLLVAILQDIVCISYQKTENVLKYVCHILAFYRQYSSFYEVTDVQVHRHLGTIYKEVLRCCDGEITTGIAVF